MTRVRIAKPQFPIAGGERCIFVSTAWSYAEYKNEKLAAIDFFDDSWLCRCGNDCSFGRVFFSERFGT